MKTSWKYGLLLAASFLIQVAAVSKADTFDEQLFVKSFRDGKVLSRFTFNTLLHDAVPREPATLKQDDECWFPTVVFDKLFY
jgi:GPI-anchor transamidase subunit T